MTGRTSSRGQHVIDSFDYLNYTVNIGKLRWTTSFLVCLWNESTVIEHCHTRCGLIGTLVWGSGAGAFLLSRSTLVDYRYGRAKESQTNKPEEIFRWSLRHAIDHHVSARFSFHSRLNMLKANERIFSSARDDRRVRCRPFSFNRYECNSDDDTAWVWKLTGNLAFFSLVTIVYCSAR